MLIPHFILCNGKTKPHHFQTFLTLSSVSVMRHLCLHLNKHLQNESTKATFGIIEMKNETSTKFQCYF